MAMPTASVKVAAMTKFGSSRSRMAPRKPIAESANMPPEASPISVGRMPPTMPPCFGRHDHDAGSGDDDRRHHRPRQHVAEKNQAEYCDLDRLGLDVGDGDDERAFAHGDEHQRGGGDLREGAENDPRPESPSRPWQRRSGRQHHADEEHQHERKAEQKSDMGGADGAELDRQFALHGVAQRLRKRGNDGEDGPQPRRWHCD